MGGIALKLALFLAAAALACLAYWAAGLVRWPVRPAPPRRRTLLTPLELALQRELDQARLPIQPLHLLAAMAGLGALGALLSAHFRSLPVILIAAGAFGLLPYQVVRVRIRMRSRAIQAAVEPLLIQLAKLCEVRHHPYLALVDALPMIRPPLRTEMARALDETQAGLPLPDALRQLAGRCCDNFYLHQVAELVAINIVSGGDLAGGLQRLAGRLRTMAELRAEEAAELFGYKWLTRLLFTAALLPLPFWAITGSPSLRVFQEHPAARGLLLWVLVSGLAIASLPYWLAIEEE